MPKRSIEATDILPASTICRSGRSSRPPSPGISANRRVDVGPFATFYFESWETVRHQIQELIYIENGGAAQLADELEAYSPLVPRGDELVATVMFEIDDAARRKTQLVRIGGIENNAVLRVGADEIRGTPDPDRENTAPDGKASSVQFFHFPLTPAQSAAFRDPATPDPARLRPPELRPSRRGAEGRADGAGGRSLRRQVRTPMPARPGGGRCGDIAVLALPDELARAEIHIGIVERRDPVAERFQPVGDLGRDAGFEIDREVAIDLPARRVAGGLGLLPVIQHADQSLEMPLRLHVAAHHAEAHDR